MRIIHLINTYLPNKKFRVFIGLNAIMGGIFRVLDHTAVDTSLGVLMLALGTLLLVTTPTRYRIDWHGRIAAGLLAGVYMALGYAVWNVSLRSAFASFLIVVFLIIEASVTYDC